MITEIELLALASECQQLAGIAKDPKLAAKFRDLANRLAGFAQNSAQPESSRNSE